MEGQPTTSGRVHATRNELLRILSAFSPLERLVFMIAVGLALIAALSLIYRINDRFMVSVPSQGGTFNEGVVGTPRFINPLLAVSDPDRDLSALIYRGLMKKNAEGDLVPDIASSYSVTDDGLTYTFKLGAAQFSDGTPVTADDVLFTVKSAQDATLKSAERVEWAGVLAKAVDAETVSFTLKAPYAPFLESTTLGILPKHVWEKVPYENWTYSEANTDKAIGAGSYKISNVSTDSNGVPVEYKLSAVRGKNSTNPYIDTIVIHFYANENELVSAYENGDVDAAGGIAPEDALGLKGDDTQIHALPLPRVFGLFFNQSQNKLFADATVRHAIAAAINRTAIVNQVLDGYGEPLQGPIPGEHLAPAADSGQDSASFAKAADQLLEKNGWKKGDDGIYIKSISKKETERLSFEIATNDAPELKSAVDLIVNELRSAGIEATPKVYETGSLNQDVIRPRKFQSLFFGEVVSDQSDLYAFWHSSQRTDPGLNISGYANSKTDKTLESLLKTLDPKTQAKLEADFEGQLDTDVPAVFVYAPAYIYVTRSEYAGITLGHIGRPEDRFSMISTWYLDTDRVWKIFAKK